MHMQSSDALVSCIHRQRKSPHQHACHEWRATYPLLPVRFRPWWSAHRSPWACWTCPCRWGWRIPAAVWYNLAPRASTSDLWVWQWENVWVPRIHFTVKTIVGERVRVTYEFYCEHDTRRTCACYVCVLLFRRQWRNMCDRMVASDSKTTVVAHGVHKQQY